ncbi:hypothetical protein M1555_00120 [Patescibacteria group bacterium]|nr:hypothetical protein [Patescibacteria group bacterium]
MNNRLRVLYGAWQQDPVAVSVLANIERYRSELTGYRGIPGAPVTDHQGH